MSADLKEMDEILEKREQQCLGKSLTKSQVQKGYDNWAKDYDNEMLNSELYLAPIEAARAVAKAFPEAQRPTMQVLDVACGTGTIGVELHNLGFRRIHGIDPNWRMVAELLPKCVYRHVILAAIGEGNSDEASNGDIPDGYYDAVVLAGAFTHGHVPYTAVYDMLRACKKGGVVVICMRSLVLTEHEDYLPLGPLMDSLEKEGKWKLETKYEFENYWRQDAGVVMTYRKC